MTGVSGFTVSQHANQWTQATCSWSNISDSILCAICSAVQAPEVFKLVFGATLGLFVTPVMAFGALIAKGRQAIPLSS